MSREEYFMNILMIVTSCERMGDSGKPTGLWLEELAAPYFEFIDAAHNVDIASPIGGSAPLDPRSLENLPPPSANFMKNVPAMAKLEATQRLDVLEKDGAEYDAYFVVGGHGIMWDGPDNEVLQRMLGWGFDNGKIVAAVCHGPAALVNVRLKDGTFLVKDRRVNSFTDAEERNLGLEAVVPFLLESKLRERGALFEKAPPMQPCVVQDGMLVTGQNPASASPLARKIVSMLAPELMEA
jgi:putative intracellular protease/amidase